MTLHMGIQRSHGGLPILEHRPIVELGQASLVEQTRVVSGFSRTIDQNDHRA